jgi:hypothetical protein
LNLDVGALEEEEYRLKGIAVDLSDIYHEVSKPTSSKSLPNRYYIPRSVISAKVKLALR